MPASLRGMGRLALSVRVAGVVSLGVGLWWWRPEILGVALARGAQGPPARLPGATSSQTDETGSSEHAPARHGGDSGDPSHAGGVSGGSAGASADGHAKAPAAAGPKPGTTLAKLNQLRAETLKRLEAVDATLAATGDSTAKTTEAANASTRPADDPRALRELLKARLDWMNEYEKAEKDYRQWTANKPDQDKARARADLEKLNALLSQAEQKPETLLPQAFRGPTNEIGDAVRTEMKDAIESIQNELKDWTTKLDAAKGEATKTAEERVALRVERDKIFQRVAALKVRAGERTSPPAKGSVKAATPESQHLDAERRLNLEWETQVESLRLMAQEARIALETKLTAVNELNIQVYTAHVQVARKILDQLQLRFGAVSDIQQRDLKRAAASEENRAEKLDDPLERYRARRTAELLEMEAQTVKFEQAVAANPSPAPDEQKAHTDRAKQDFEELKKLIKDGEVSRLDAMRLNNDFRRIGPERDRLDRNELTLVEARVQFYADALTEAELELIEDAHQDQFEHDALLERLPASRRGAAAAVFEQIERKHGAILIRRRDALKVLANRATDTLREVTARIAVLNDEYGFIRTNIFWVRDQDPIGPETIGQGGRELARLTKAILRLTEETLDRRNWNRASAEFVAASVGLVVLPIGLFRLRRKIGHQIHLDLYGAETVPELAGSGQSSASESPAERPPGYPEPD